MYPCISCKTCHRKKNELIDMFSMIAVNPIIMSVLVFFIMILYSLYYSTTILSNGVYHCDHKSFFSSFECIIFNDAINNWWARSSNAKHRTQLTSLLRMTATIVEFAVGGAECLSSWFKDFTAMTNWTHLSVTRILSQSCINRRAFL